MLLFTVSLVMILGVLPYLLLTRHRFQWSYVAGAAFWMGAGFYAYTALFHSGKATEEKPAEKRTPALAPRGILWGGALGAACGAVSFLLFAFVLSNSSSLQLEFSLGSFGLFVLAGFVVGTCFIRR